MASRYTAQMPPGWILAKVHDQEWKGLEAGMPAPDVREVSADVTQVTWAYLDDRTVAPQLVAAWAAAIADPTPPTSAPWQVRELQETRIDAQLDTLRAYRQLVTPTAAQRLAFEKAAARVLLNLVRLVRQDTTEAE